MDRLTRERCNGIKDGYWSAAKKEELAQRLGAYEDTGLTPKEIIDGKMLTGWIPVEERLPEAEGQYLITLSESGFVDVDIYKNSGWEFWGEDVSEDVLAWMPLPEPYKPKY